jgi:nitrogen fixation/metabolism regulation signal transduction histidine kinase
VVHSLRRRLIAAFLVATVLPLGASIWIASTLLDRSLSFATTDELDRLSRTLENTVRQFYQRERDALGRDAAEGRLTARRYVASEQVSWPEEVQAFAQSSEPERFTLAGAAGDRLDLLRRTADGVSVFSRDLGAIHMNDLAAEVSRTREAVASLASRDLRRGFTLTLFLLVGLVWLLSLAPIVLMAHRVSRPIRELTAGLSAFAGGDWNRRLDTTRTDEVGRAVTAFNDMAEQLRASRDRLVYLAQMSSWQSLARKTAHELKNSLTPIRLTVEEMLARQPTADRAFMAQAAAIVIAEIESLEARVRAFSEFASDPVVTPELVDVNAVVRDRVLFLGPAHPETAYRLQLDAAAPRVFAGADLLRSILTNLLENAAEAAGPKGTVLAVTRATGSDVVIEVHDSGPGVSEQARDTLFEPSITFKKHGMGLGLSIVRKNALVSGGDVALIAGELGGAGFRVTLPPASRGVQAS